MAISVSLPTIWSARIEEYLDKALVFVPAFTNNAYEGEAREGSTVKILSVGELTIGDYDGSDIDAAEDLTDAAATLTLNQKKYFNFRVLDTDDQFSAIALIDQGSQRAAYGIADTLDQYIASLHSSVSSSSPDNTYGDSTTPIDIGTDTGEVLAYDAHLELAERLDLANVPKTGRRAVYPSWFVRRLKKELGGRASGLGDNITLNGFMGELDGVQIYQSNNVVNTTDTKYKCMMGLPYITLARAIAKVETYRQEANFGTGVKGLYVYGAVMTKPAAFALGTFSKGLL